MHDKPDQKVSLCMHDHQNVPVVVTRRIRHATFIPHQIMKCIVYNTSRAFSGKEHLPWTRISLIEELRAQSQYRMDHHSMEVSILKILRTPVTWHFGAVWLVLAAQVSADDYCSEIQERI